MGRERPRALAPLASRRRQAAGDPLGRPLSDQRAGRGPDGPCPTDDWEGSIDKATFVKRADTICKKISGRLVAETKAQAQEEFKHEGMPGHLALI